MAENDIPAHRTDDAEAETRSSKTEQQEQQEQRIQTGERMSMDPTDMADAIDQEEDQKFDGQDKTRYEHDVDRALSDEAP